MGLVTCPDCSQEVSDRAETCPRCGGPILVSANPGYRPVQPIEQTGKQWKMLQLVGGILLVGSLVSAIWALDGSEMAAMATILLFAGGFTMAVIGRLGGWWYHR